MFLPGESSLHIRKGDVTEGPRGEQSAAAVVVADRSDEGPNGAEGVMPPNLDEAMAQMSGQLELPFASRGDAASDERSVSASTAERGDRRAGTSDLMAAVVERRNCLAALKRVRQNKGNPGIDGMTVEELPTYLKGTWLQIRERLLAGTYQPLPVKRGQLPKRGGGMRELGIPTVLDRFIQQAILQVLQPRFDPTFSSHSHGFRPGHRAHDAVREAQRYVQDGRWWVVDVDLEKFLDAASYCPPGVDASYTRLGCVSKTLMRKPLRRPHRTWRAWSSPRLTRCNTVWRETPSRIVASSIGR